MSSKAISQSLPKALSDLEQDPSCHRLYRPGQPLTANGILPNQIIIILEGRARLLTTEQNQTATLLKLGPGDVVGLASLISAAPCERVHASTKVRAALLTDQSLIRLLENDEEFNKVLGKACIASGGVVPNVHAALVKTKKSSASQEF